MTITAEQGRTKPLMPIVAHQFRFVIGVDTHARNHVYCILDAATGAHVDTEQFPTSPAGMKRALSWARRRTNNETSVLWVIEGIGSYGAILASTVTAAGFSVAEAARMDSKGRHGVGKSDPIDARRIAAAILGSDVDQLRTPRCDSGVRAALRVLIGARDQLTADRTGAINALTALLRTVDLDVDARKPLSRVQIAGIARWRRRDEGLAMAVARDEATRLAKRITSLDGGIDSNTARITEIVKISAAAPLLDKPGIGPVTAATCLVAYSHRGRIRTEAAFAALAGASPIPASSGNTVRHRLNRGGDRRLNRALHMIAITRMHRDAQTRIYVDRRTAEGLTSREIRRIIKRYLARQIYRILNSANPQPCLP